MIDIPKIGITCDFEAFTDRRGRPSARFVLAAPYVRAVVQAGGQPWLLVHDGTPAPDVMPHIDGLVISGGDFDIPPSFYGAPTRAGCGRTLQARSSFERDLCRLALAQDLPLLGICGGMQLLCVVLGGSLHQDLSERSETGEHQQPHDTSQPFHAVHLTPGSLAARCYGMTDVGANTTHHQLIAELGPTLVASGHAPDGVVEAIEAPGQSFALGLQWHPEVLLCGTSSYAEHLGPYVGLVQAAADRARHRAARECP